MQINGDLLLRLRLDRGWTQEQAAEKIGIDTRTYRRYERREIQFTSRAGQFEIVQAIAAAFKLAGPEALLDGNIILSSSRPQEGSNETPSYQSASMASEPPFFDRFAPIRIQITARYLDYLQRCVRSVPESILISDVTGLATGFACWLSPNPVYQSVLVANSQCQASIRRAHGDKVPGVRRTFFVDPIRMDSAAVDRLSEILRVHLFLGLQAAIIYTGPNVSEDMIADLCLFGTQSAADFGHFEQLDISDIGPQDVFVSSAEKSFENIKERAQWTLAPRNVDHIVIKCKEDARDAVEDLHTRIVKQKS